MFRNHLKKTAIDGYPAAIKSFATWCGDAYSFLTDENHFKCQPWMADQLGKGDELSKNIFKAAPHR